MGYPTKVQLIKRKDSEQWNINFPVALAQAMEFQRGETVEWIIEDKSQLVLRRPSAPASALKKTTLPPNLMAHWHRLFDSARPAFVQQRTFERARSLALAALACLGRRTISGLLCAAGQQHHDWSAAYRLFEMERVDPELLWSCLRHQCFDQLPPAAPVVALMHDTLRRKRGTHISGTSWRRDPPGSAFADNSIWASLFLQVSLALPARSDGSPSPARAIRIDLQHAPSPRKPSKKAPPEAWDEWRSASATATVSALGARRIAALRADLDTHPDGQTRPLQVCVDCTFTCRAVFRGLPSRTTLIGRIRKDATLYALPTASQLNPGRGRQRCYGDRLPTPSSTARIRPSPGGPSAPARRAMPMTSR